MDYIMQRNIFVVQGFSLKDFCNDANFPLGGARVLMLKILQVKITSFANCTIVSQLVFIIFMFSAMYKRHT